jgi:hypothetical protein
VLNSENLFNKYLQEMGMHCLVQPGVTVNWEATVHGSVPSILIETWSMVKISQVVSLVLLDIGVTSLGLQEYEGMNAR